jgi:hypothetical protein
LFDDVVISNPSKIEARRAVTPTGYNLRHERSDQLRFMVSDMPKIYSSTLGIAKLEKSAGKGELNMYCILCDNSWKANTADKSKVATLLAQ